MLDRSINFLIGNKLVAFILLLLFLGWGIVNSPFDLGMGILPHDPVNVDAIPDLGENQQIVYTEWNGQSPRDIEDQITYPLTSTLLGIPGIKTVRSSSMFGFSSIYIIFEEDIDFYWARGRILEKLSSIPSNLLPKDVRPTLGPDATAMGQIFWYTLEGRDQQGKVTGGWDLHEVRSVQDFYVKNALAATEGVSEVASIGGFVQEYQVDVDPELMKQYNVSLSQVVRALKENNKDVGAKTLEINQAEYFIRGLGYVTSIDDIANSPVRSDNFTPILIRDIAKVSMGPADRRGILDKGGAEVVGGVVVSRYGANPLKVIQGIKERIKASAAGMPSKILKDGSKTTLTIVPFYDRTELIGETLDTLGDALTFEILITVLVVILMLSNLRVSALISGLLPVAVLMVFIAMKIFKVEANIVALSGIAIAIGTIVDMGIILSENIVRHLEIEGNSNNIDRTVYKATTEVSGAIVTAGLTTIISFIPVFVLTGAEGKLFGPLAFTKTVALSAALVTTLFLIPPFAALVFRKYVEGRSIGLVFNGFLVFLGTAAVFMGHFLGLALWVLAIVGFLKIYGKLSPRQAAVITLSFCCAFILLLLAIYWRPLGYGWNIFFNFFFVALLCGLVLGTFMLFMKYYTQILNWALRHKMVFLGIPLFFVTCGLLIMGSTGKEFMPSLDEGSFLLMPSSLPHSGTAVNKEVLQRLDMAVAQIPEVEKVLGKAGRVESALDPAPLSMYENIIFYKTEYIEDENGRPIPFKVNEKGDFETKSGEFVGMAKGASKEDLVPDRKGEFYRNWRSSVRTKADIWELIKQRTTLPGVTSAPKLQPIETRMVMLQTGMRSPMGIKVKGQDLGELERFGKLLGNVLKEVEGVDKESVFADRIMGKPYLLLDIDRKKTARYGISIDQVQEALEVAIGGKVMGQTVEGRERYSIRVRYPRELRAGPEDLEAVYVNLDNGGTVPLGEFVTVNYELGPQSIKGEDGFYIGYVVFDKLPEMAEQTVIANATEKIRKKLESGELQVPPGMEYEFSGTYENQLHAERTLSYVVPLVLMAIFLILYFQFRSVSIALMVFSGVAVAFAGGFILIWLYGQPWFMDFMGIRELFNIRTVYLSVAVWVGFLALFGIATDDGVVMATYLVQVFRKNDPTSIAEIRESVVEAGKKRIRPCLMTTGTTILALLPVLTSTSRGSDIMIAMAIPAFGGMLMALITLFVVPVLFSWKKERILSGKGPSV
tara:strand:+ start:114682 stop:118359 length:3678 start_codon:yes stop_codon:yes gene_type:complete